MCSNSEATGTGPRRVVVATGNLHKIDEISSALAPFDWEFISVDDLGGWDAPEETGETFLDNARIKARTAHERFGLPSLADDSGLEVDALGGEPGVYSSRYAGDDATDSDNNERLLRALGNIEPASRTARFRSVIVLIDEDGAETAAQGTCEGRIGFERKGEQGFGYDPLFEPHATPGRTMAELDMAAKNAISHRGAALRALRDILGA